MKLNDSGNRILKLAAMVLAALLVSCAPSTPASPTVTPTRTPSPPAAAPTLPSPPTPTPSPLTLALPADWAHPGQPAQLSRLVDVKATYDPASLLQKGEADLALIRGQAPPGWPHRNLFQEPIAAVVPFTYPLESLSMEELSTLLGGESENSSKSLLVWDREAPSLLDLGSGVQVSSVRGISDALEKGKPVLALMPWSEVRYPARPISLDEMWPDDEGYPVYVPISLVVSPAADSRPEVQMVAEILRPPPIIRLAAVGDIMLGRTVGQAMVAQGADHPFAQVAGTLRSADITFGNLECAISDRGEPLAKSYTFRAHPSAAQGLASAGFDVLSLANNHSMDYGPIALCDTLDHLQGAGISAVGAGRSEEKARQPQVIEVNGLRVAFLAYAHFPSEWTGFSGQSVAAQGESPGLAWAEAEKIRREVQAAKHEADIVVVSIHAGQEYLGQPTSTQREIAHAAVEGGAALVIGHHPHVLQGAECYGDGIIAYSLGNFVFDMEVTESVILQAWLDRRGVKALSFLPARIEEGRPHLLDPETEGGPLLAEIYHLSGELQKVSLSQ